MPAALDLILLLLSSLSLLGGNTTDTTTPGRLKPGDVPPKLFRKVEPKYTQSALDARIQGNVLIDLVIDEAGSPQNIVLLSPLGFGLDERAQEAVANWEFNPATRNGTPVAIRATVEVSFRLSNVAFDSKEEGRRTQFNGIVSRWALDDTSKPGDKDIQTMQELAHHKYVPAEFIVGKWEIQGVVLPKDQANGLALVQHAAAKNYGPALYLIGDSYVKGDLLPKDAEKGYSLIRNAAVLGSRQAQFVLGGIYEHGSGVPTDTERAKRYYRLCAAAGTPECQYHLGKLLLAGPQRDEDQWLQAIAWLELADGHHLAEAQKLVDVEQAKLTSDQTRWIARLKPQLERTPN